jgi:CHAT domain-containing protein
MAGANHILEGEELPNNVEDGILTAKEIADVDLRGLDLVVLSACQTGLGDISQGEGVFGLQRGFKKAGAKTILMSLWKVNDDATQILMTQFYKNWLSGQSKRQALLSAQKHLREVDGGIYNEPKYWAAFILLDGMN